MIASIIMKHTHNLKTVLTVFQPQVNCSLKLPLLHVKENGDSDDIIVVSQKDDMDILVSVPVSDNCKHDNITVNNPKDHVIIFTVKRKIRRLAKQLIIPLQLQGAG